MVWTSVAVALPTTLVADWVILILYGANFQEAADILRIYIWAGVFVTLGIAGSKWLVAENLQRYLFYRTALGALLNVGCNFWFEAFLKVRRGRRGAQVRRGAHAGLSLIHI